MTTAAYVLALVALALRGASAQSRCIGVTFNTFADGFRYNLYLNLNSCSSSQVNISKLVMQGACSNQRSNNFGSYPKCSNGGSNLVDAGTGSCNTFFRQAPSDAIVRNAGGGNYDSGKICSDSDNAYVFVQTTCSSFSASQVRLTTNGYGSGFCWNGHTLSAGGAVGIAIAVVVVVFLIVFFGVRYGCRRRRTVVTQTGPAINMQPYPQPPPQGYNQPAPYGGQYQGYPDQGYPNQGYPQQGYPAQGYPAPYQQPSAAAGKY